MTIINRITNRLYDFGDSVVEGARRARRLTVATGDLVYKSGTSLYRVANSVLGKKALASIRENLVEFYAYYVGAELTAPLGKEVGQDVGKAAGKAFVLASALFASCVLKDLVALIPINASPQVKTALHTAASIGGGLLIGNLAAGAVTPFAMGAGELVGENIGYYIGGIITSYVGIRLFGSDEAFWYAPSFLKTYPVKTAISMAGTALITQQAPFLQNNYTQFLTDLAIGSLIYNSLDLGEASLNMQRGHFLDRVLPKKIVVPGLVKKVVEVSHHLVDQEMEKMAMKALFDDSQFHKVVSLPLLLYAKQAEALPIECMRDFTEEKLSNLLMRGVNLYMAVLQKHPDIFSNMPTILERSKQAQTLFNTILSLQRLEEDGVWSPLFTFLTKSIFSDSKPVISPEEIDSLTERVVEGISNQEQKLFGFCLSGSREREKIQTFLQTHLQPIIYCTLFCLPTLAIPLAEAEARTFYSSSLSVAPEYYNRVIGKTAAGWMGRFLKHQASHSQLSD